VTVLWTPDGTSTMERFAAHTGHADYGSLFRWSIEDLEGFWQSVWDFFGLQAHTPHARVLGRREMPGAEWFPGATLNYAEHMLHNSGEVAVVARSRTRAPRELTFRELRDQVARARAGLQRLGIGRGDRVVAYLPNIPETLAAFLATASLGAIWASVAPEFGPRSVIDRFAQLEPKLLLAVRGYVYRDARVDRTEALAAIRAGLPTLEHVVELGYGDEATGWEELTAEPGPPACDPVPFDHPLYVLFSSGTTGLPKAIVHGHGGILVEHCKLLGLTWDVRPGDRLLQFTTTAWMMWNALVSCLALRASVALVDGDPAYPDPAHQWRLAEETGATHLGLAPVFLMRCR
jgi:acetoacetyl-CoA synthetase